MVKFNFLSDIFIPFLIGGSIISGVKLASKYVKNPALAAIIGGIPTGLLAAYFVAKDKSVGYIKNYFYITLCLLISILLFYVLLTYSHLDKKYILLIAIVCWGLGVFIRYILNDVNSKKKEKKL